MRTVAVYVGVTLLVGATCVLPGCYEDVADNSTAVRSADVQQPAPPTGSTEASLSGTGATTRPAGSMELGKPAGGALAGAKRAGERTVDKMQQRDRQIGEEADKLSGGGSDEEDDDSESDDSEE